MLTKISCTLVLRIKVWAVSNRQDDLNFIIDALTKDEFRWEYSDFSRKTKNLNFRFCCWCLRF